MERWRSASSSHLSFPPEAEACSAGCIRCCSGVGESRRADGEGEKTAEKREKREQAGEQLERRGGREAYQEEKEGD